VKYSSILFVGLIYW